MKRSHIIRGMVCLAASISFSANAAEMALVPVAASGPHAIVGNEIILAEAGQEVTLEIRASDWDPDVLRIWQADVDEEGFVSGDAGTALPLGWDRPFDPTPCLSDADCPSDLSCDETWMCAGPDHDPFVGFFSDASRPDYVFFDIIELAAVDPISYRIGSTVLEFDAYPVYVEPPKYCATLILVVSEDAAGTFTIELVGEGLNSSLFRPDLMFIPTELIPASITIAPGICRNGACEDGEDETSCPADCTSGPWIRPIRNNRK